MIVNKSFFVLSLFFAATSCTVFAEEKAPEDCKASDRAINTANYIVLMKTAPLAGNVRSVQITGNSADDTHFTNTLTFSRCGQLLKRLFVAEIRMSDERLAVTTSDLHYQDKGWVQEMKNDFREKGQVMGEVRNTRYFYTDKQGHISGSSADVKEGQNWRIQTKWTYHYDEQHRLTQEKAESVRNKDRPQNFTEVFRYDARGRLIQISSGQRNQSFSWDDKVRLVSVADMNKAKDVERDKKTICYEWDSAGNCTAATIDETFRMVGSDQSMHKLHYALRSSYQYWDN